ncbi:MAG: Gfo/Idh/MocA family oxidoreductase [Acidobacteriota bacterium]|nr:Gfo/Idh/MocA family oxidoreductase [Acidobacteriota bacterium]
MIKVGLISAATYGYMDAPRTPGSFHGTAFASAFNGYDPEKSKQYQWTFAAASRRMEGVQVTKVWDPHREWAEKLADVCSIPEVTETPEECTVDVDAVCIVDDGSAKQADYAIPAMEKGIPTFIDKPIALTAKRAKEIVDVAKRTGAPLMSASSLRFVPDILNLAAEVPSLGDINLATTICGNALVYYGIHALETAYAVLGPGAVSSYNVGQPGRNVVRVRYANGRDLILMVAERDYMRAGYQINLYGTGGWRSVMPDLSDLYIYLLDQFLSMIREGRKFVVPLDEIVEVIAVLEAGERSLAEGREVFIEEVLA